MFLNSFIITNLVCNVTLFQRNLVFVWYAELLSVFEKTVAKKKTFMKLFRYTYLFKKIVNASNVYLFQHSIDCGAGTAIFLAINSSTIIVIRGKRACLWGSVYLDAFGEEDRELK